MNYARTILILSGLFLGLNLLGVHAGLIDDVEDKKGEAKLPLCPVMDEPVNFYIMTDTKDGPVYFCCKRCIADYEKDPSKFSDKVTAQRKALHELPAVQVSCPITGKPVDKKTTIEEKGHKIAFCCAKCPEVFKKDPAKYHGKLMAGLTYQTKCPVMDEEIKPTVFTEIGGQKVYFCCKKCIKEFESDPAKYAPKLEEQGYHLKLPKKP